MPINDSISRKSFAAKSKAPSVSFFDTFISEEFFSHFVASSHPSCFRVLDTQDMHGIRYTREHRWQHTDIKDIDRLLMLDDDWMLGEVALREGEAMERSDLVLVCSDYEKKVLEKVRPNLEVELVTFFYDGLEIQKMKDKLAGNRLGGRRKNFVWLGNYMHRPNHAATKILLEKLWPKIVKELPSSLGYTLDLYGSNFSQEIKTLAKDIPQVRCKVISILAQGILQSISKLSEYHSLLAPIPYGAGIKG